MCQKINTGHKQVQSNQIMFSGCFSPRSTAKTLRHVWFVFFSHSQVSAMFLWKLVVSYGSQAKPGVQETSERGPSTLTCCALRRSILTVIFFDHPITTCFNGPSRNIHGQEGFPCTLQCGRSGSFPIDENGCSTLDSASEPAAIGAPPDRLVQSSSSRVLVYVQSSSTLALLQFYSSSTLVLVQVYSSFTLVLVQFYSSSTLVLLQFYSSSSSSTLALVLVQFYSSSTLVLLQFLSSSSLLFGLVFCFVLVPVFSALVVSQRY